MSDSGYMAARWYQQRVHGVNPAPPESQRLPPVATAAMAKASHGPTGASSARTRSRARRPPSLTAAAIARPAPTIVTAKQASASSAKKVVTTEVDMGG